MKITANIATQPSRLGTLPAVVDSLYHQVDELRVCLNGFPSVPGFLKRDRIRAIIPDHDLTDNGKFLFVPPASVREICFTADDDILYPKDYVAKTLANMQKHPGHIITYHGRKLKGKGLRYYHDHLPFRFLDELLMDQRIDVAGTGVTAFDTQVFSPLRLWRCKHLLMSDLVFSKQAAEEKVPITICAKSFNWIKYLHPADAGTIHSRFYKSKTPVHDLLADQIYLLNHES